MMMFMKEKQAQHKRDARVARPLSFNDRTPLAALVPDMELTGIVISLTHFGAYVDVGSECDGLLHVSQFTTDDFVSHPRAVVTPGQEITVRVRSCCPERRKLQLTMLPLDVVQAQRENAVAQDRIELSQIETDDELWGELKRVTNYGAYVEVGAVVDGFLHFMDHPDWEDGALPTQFMKVGDRVRVWVADVDHERKRIKLTANRPKHVPGPIREWTRQ
jgi:small subunit ribosomal protein S1